MSQWLASQGSADAVVVDGPFVNQGAPLRITITQIERGSEVWADDSEPVKVRLLIEEVEDADEGHGQPVATVVEADLSWEQAHALRLELEPRIPSAVSS